jgi:competence protein ComEC
MIKTGTLHILVVSGFNVGVVGFLILFLLKLMRIKRRPCVFIAAAALIFYCLMSGASNPVVRATVMGEAFLFSRLFRREAGIYNSLGAAALSILIFSLFISILNTS